MKNTIFIPLLFLFSFSYSQDIITFIDGDTLQAKIVEINYDYVWYKKYAYLDGPTYSVLHSDIISIQYPNGEKDIFNESVADAENLRIVEPYFKEDIAPKLSLEERMKKTDLKIYKMYRSGKAIITLGSVIAVPGIFVIGAIKHNVENSDVHDSDPIPLNRNLLVMGAVSLVTGGVLVLVGGSKKLQAQSKFKEKIANKNSLQLHIKPYGIGLTYNF